MATVGNRHAAKAVATTTPGPWKDWKRLSRHGRAIRFIETYCAAPKGHGHGRPLKLAGFQKTFLEAALADGIDIAVLATPRGNGKSSLGGALATWALFDDDDTGAPQVPIIATTVGQAIRSCYGVATSMVRRSPELERRSLIYTGIGTSRIVVPANEGEMFPVSNDVDGLQGLDPSLAIVDEIGFQPQVSWDALRLASGKRERSLTIGVGTPGLDRDNALFQLRKLVHEGGRPPGVVFREHAAPLSADISDRRVWRAANPAMRAGFLRAAALETDFGIGLEGPFRVFRLGQWYEGVDSWLGPNGRAIWDALDEPYDFVAGAETWIGVDVGIKRDSTAVVAVQKDDAGHFRATCRLWVPSDDQPVDVTDVMEHLRELARAYQVASISYDPRLFDVPAKMLEDEGLPLHEVPQSPERMTPACGGLLELIKRGDLRHDGDDAFTTQVLNAVPRFNERGFTLQKSKSRGRIDAAIALALAIDEAQHHEPVAESLIAWR